MIFVVGKLTLKPGKNTVFMEGWAELIEEYRKEPGCIMYHVGRSTTNENLWYMISHWESEELYDKHLEGPFYQRAYAYSIGFLTKEPEIERCYMDV